MKYICHIPILFTVVIGCSAPVEEIALTDAYKVKESPPVKALDGDWPWWRGPNLDGHAEGESPPVSWSDSKNVIWKADVPGRGHATPTVVLDRVFVSTADEPSKTMSLVCYQRSDGKLMWESRAHEGGFMHMHGKNSHASATPACDGERVFTVFMVNNGIYVTAVDLDGERLWQVEAGPFKSKHGYGSSPVLHKSLIIVAGDNHGSGFLAAIDRETGKIMWRVARKNSASFATPVIANVAGQTQLLMSGQGKVVSYNPDDGSELWSCKGPASTTANTMAWHDDLVLASGGYPEKNVMAIRADGTGEVLWQDSIKAYVPSLLVNEGRLLVIQDHGITTCFDIDTGKELWKQRLGSGHFSASPVLANENVFVPNEAGTMFVFKMGERFESLAENYLSEGGFASPVICGGQLFIRTAEHLYCVGRESSQSR